jgi:hypothetical protein
MPVKLEDGTAKEYEVEAILDKKTIKGKTKYLMR